MMKVLIADDAEVVRLLIGRFVESLGHEVVLATDGLHAVDVYLQQQPDMVLMDMLMPGMDGPEAARQIKSLSPERWVPVVLVTSVGEEGRLADAIETGADDYLLKPVNYRILEAKIKAIQRTVDLHRKVRDQSIKLAEYFDHAEEEKGVARHLMEQLVSRERLHDPHLQYWIAPAESLSGDLIAAARTPGDVLHVLLADGIGHGLTAALNVLPLTEPFYAMTGLGFEMPDILLEMCRKVRQVLPAGRFVAMALVAVDFTSRYIEVWNAGIPDIHMVDAEGHVLKTWVSRHLPLGILPEDQLDLVCERYTFTQPGRLLLCSDGLLEARNAAGENFGSTRLIQACAHTLHQEAIPNLLAELSGFLAGAVCHDDVSVAVVEVSLLDPAVRQGNQQDLPPGFVWPQATDLPEWRHQLRLGAEALREVHAVPQLVSFLQQIRSLKNAQGDIFQILTELFTNARDHGVLGLASSLKTGSEGLEVYFQERARRLAGLTGGYVEIELAGFFVDECFVLRIRVSDSGAGFDVGEFTRQAGLGLAFGRGIAAVQARCARVDYGGMGNTVEAFYLPSSL